MQFSAAVVNLDHPGHYLHWGVIQISVANLVVIALMRRCCSSLALVAAVPEGTESAMTAPTDADRHWTGAAARARPSRSFPPEKLLPDRQPAYVASWIYVFGVLTLAAFVVVHRRPAACWPSTGRSGGTARALGHFVNSLHLWSVELFFVVHGHPPVGQVLDGGLARPARADLDHRRVSLPRLDRHRVHRLPGADQLRLAVDRLRGQGRAELGRHRRLVQRRSTSARCCCGTSCCCRWSSASIVGLARAAGAPARRRAADRRRPTATSHRRSVPTTSDDRRSDGTRTEPRPTAAAVDAGRAASTTSSRSSSSPWSS